MARIARRRALLLAALATCVVGLPATASAMPDGGYMELRDYDVVRTDSARWTGSRWEIPQVRTYVSGTNAGKTCYGVIVGKADGAGFEIIRCW